MMDELLALQRNETQTLVPLTSNWKANPDGIIHKYKARLVAMGFHQTTGFDFIETFGSMVKLATIKITLPIAL